MNIDVYDFDKTIYNGDSTIDFYLYCIKKNLLLLRYFPIQLLYYIKYKLKLVNKEKFKKKFFIFLNGINNIDDYIIEFWKKNKNKVRYEIIKQNENKKYIISASPEFLLQSMVIQMNNFELIATKVNKKSGRFESKNCYGEEKVKRLKKHITNEFKIENFYSDSISDKYLAEISQNSYIVKNGGKIEKWNQK